MKTTQHYIFITFTIGGWLSSGGAEGGYTVQGNGYNTITLHNCCDAINNRAFSV